MRALILIISITFLSACSNNNNNNIEANAYNPKVLSTFGQFKSSTLIGNFAATAVQRAHNLDFAFLPAVYFNDQAAAYIDLNMEEVQIKKVMDLFEAGPMDELLIGTMKGKALKTFLINRSRETYGVEVETAGLWYSISFNGGIVTSANFSVDGRLDLEDEKYYRIAVSDDFYFGSAFPGYKYRNAFNFNFKRAKYRVSLRESIKTYLETAKEFPLWSKKRASVNHAYAERVGYKKISEIQGAAHASPYLNKRVVTRGVITAIGTPDWYPKGTDLYIESIEPDDDERTSEGLHIHSYRLDLFGQDLKIGDYIEVSGTVFEDIRVNGMGDTTLRFLEDIKVLDTGLESKLPKAVQLSRSGRSVPTKAISTYGGKLMEKGYLNLNDGVDFWESLESMRVEMRDPVVLGFRGGKEDYYEKSSKSYLNLYITPKEFITAETKTYHGGLLIDEHNGDRNPEVVSLITAHLTDAENLDEEKFYKVGDVFEGSFEGVLIYNKNIFGGGEYAVVTPKVQPTLSENKVAKGSRVSLSERPVTKLQTDEPSEITLATYNLENLSAFQTKTTKKGVEDRITYMADSIVTNLKCPDILNLVEIQDNNGIDFRGSQNADITIRKLKALVQSECLNVNYQIVEVPPFLHGEGGQPGGNIRVSILYNSKKLDYEYRDDKAYGTPAIVLEGGRLSNNPGRVNPNNEAFRRSRRSLVVEFDVLAKPGEKLYVIGNHLNSKLGDMDFWGNEQIARPASDDSRGRKTALINKFIHWLQKENPRANIVVLGDFNALADEDSMQILTDKEQTLQNMIFTLPVNKRYTTNHNGNSQPLDYVFVNTHITNTKKPVSEILHINSDYMARLSDHDPVMLRLSF